MARGQTGLRLTGDREIDSALRAMEGKLQLKVARKATRKATRDIVLPEALARVPVRTGALENSLVVRSVGKLTKKQKKARRTGANKHVKQSFIGHLVETRGGWFQGDQFYGGFVEFGTEMRTSYRGNRGMIARNKFAFLRPALYGNEARIKNLFISALRQFIREAGK